MVLKAGYIGHVRHGRYQYHIFRSLGKRIPHQDERQVDVEHGCEGSVALCGRKPDRCTVLAWDWKKDPDRKSPALCKDCLKVLEREEKHHVVNTERASR